MPKHYVIKEYEQFYCDKEETNQVLCGCQSLPLKTFEALEKFVLANKKYTDVDTLELMSLSAKRGVGKVISAKNYVGIIAMKDGTIIEILPKIYSQQEDNINQTKKIFLNMLKSLRNSPYKSFQVANIHTEKLNILEIFIKMFIEEVYTIVKRGLKCDYMSIEGNENFFKGRIKFSDHIKANFAHNERAYIEFDIFNCDRSENRLIKTTLLFLKGLTKSLKNKNDIITLLAVFDEVNVSVNYEQDFAKYTSDRNMKEYDTVIQWCKVFLTNKSFTSFTGSEVAYSLLFPMEKVFEAYVADKLAKALDKTRYTIRTQDNTYSLFDYPSKRFSLRPDIIIKDKACNQIVVLDTKWKILSSLTSNYGISQADMYQMYAYDKKYCSEKVILLYPLTNLVNTHEIISFTSKDGVIVRVKFVNIQNISNSIQEILTDI